MKCGIGNQSETEYNVPPTVEASAWNFVFSAISWLLQKN